jgi:hypothetical protein
MVNFFVGQQCSAVLQFTGKISGIIVQDKKSKKVLQSLGRKKSSKFIIQRSIFGVI